MFEVKRGEFGLVSVGEKEDAPILESDPMPAQSHQSQIPAKRFQALTTGSHRIGKWVRVTCAPSFASLTSAMCCGLRLRFRGPGSWGGPLPSWPRLCPILLISDHSTQTSKQGVYFSRAISSRCHALSSSPVNPPSCLWFREREQQQRTYDHLRSVRTQARRIPTGKRRRHRSFRQGIGHNHRQACRSPRAGRTGLGPMTTLARGTVGESLTFSIAESAFPSRKASEFVF